MEWEEWVRESYGIMGLVLFLLWVGSCAIIYKGLLR